ncbi:hypothetical protein MLD38_000897 [Melastoma candidum]|uniref:Uncharacterized protein n=1 Tax=Melastoma candidum TaxID=119954 RepID=A0ACB9SD42_9MYRT|nr:hypothetical protein MLD38_000897 [Melastoma candidum]
MMMMMKKKKKKKKKGGNTCAVKEMDRLSGRCSWVSLMAVVVVVVVLCCLQGASGIRFVIDREECFSHDVKYQGDTVHASFVVIDSHSPWHYDEDSVRLVVKGPTGEQIYDIRNKISEKFDFVARNKGVHRFSFTNNSPHHVTVDFDVHLGHFSFRGKHAKDEHFNPLLQQIEKLGDALYKIEFEQHWLGAQTDQQVGVNEAMGARALKKAVLESGALILASILQVYLLRRLFERKTRVCWV